MNFLDADRTVFGWINGLSGHFGLPDNIMRAIANDYFAIVTGCLIMMALWIAFKDADRRRHIQKGIMVASASLGTAQGMVEIINNIWARPRPFDEMEVNLIFYAPTDPSFPSNSASVLFGMAWGIFLYNRRAGLVLLSLAGIHGLSRIYVGVHYPLDIVGGMLLGLVVALFFWTVFRLLDPLLNHVIDLLRWFFLA
jgi:undecaprenyl-diphosphatase